MIEVLGSFAAETKQDGKIGKKNFLHFLVYTSKYEKLLCTLYLWVSVEKFSELVFLVRLSKTCYDM